MTHDAIVTDVICPPENKEVLGFGGGLVVRVLAFYFEDPSLYPKEVEIFENNFVFQTTHSYVVG